MLNYTRVTTLNYQIKLKKQLYTQPALSAARQLEKQTSKATRFELAYSRLQISINLYEDNVL